MYLWMWSSFMHSNNTHVHHTTIVDETGRPAFNVGEEGFNAGEGATLDANAPFEAPDCPIEPVEGVGGEVSDGTDFGFFDSQATTDAGSSWFDSFAFGGDASSGSSGAGSCSGAGAACGSSCGGGGGSGCCGSGGKQVRFHSVQL